MRQENASFEAVKQYVASAPFLFTCRVTSRDKGCLN